MLKSATSVVRWIYVDALYCTSEVFFKSAKCEKIVAVNEHIARPWFPIRESASFDLPMTMERVMDKETRFHCKWLIFFAYPRKFEFIYLVLCHYLNIYK